MSLAVLYSCALMGMSAPRVCVEVHLSAGLPNMTIVGLPDAGVRESRERVRSAIDTSGYEFSPGRFTVNLSPTALPKESGRFDLPIALGVLLATGQVRISAERLASLEHTFFIGELSLTGVLIPVQAPLIIGLSIYRQYPDAVLVMPYEDAQVAARIEGLKVIGVRTLQDAVSFLRDEQSVQAMSTQNFSADSQLVDTRNAGRTQQTGKKPQIEQNPQAGQIQQVGNSPICSHQDAESLCLSDIRGQVEACNILEVVASGGHGLLLSGSPGVGKSMLANRLPTLLPKLSTQHALEVMALQSISRQNLSHTDLPFSQAVPFRAPHHSASMVALVGGGPNASPGEISMAHHGVLFLDELPEFDRRALEALREPLERGEIVVTRAKRSQVYPARFQLIAAHNPCPCGYLGHPDKPCVCTPDAIHRYQNKLSGPLLDRIDVHWHVRPVEKDWIRQAPAESSAQVRARVIACRERQYARQGCLNAHLSESQISEYCVLAPAIQQLLENSIARFAWSARVTHRVLKVARTIADMHEHEQITEQDFLQAVACRPER